MAACVQARVNPFRKDLFAQRDVVQLVLARGSLCAQGRTPGGLLAPGGRPGRGRTGGVGDLSRARRRPHLGLEPLVPAIREGPAPIGRVPATELRGMTKPGTDVGSPFSARATWACPWPCGRSQSATRLSASTPTKPGQGARRRRLVRPRRLGRRPAARRWLRVATGSTVDDEATSKVSTSRSSTFRPRCERGSPTFRTSRTPLASLARHVRPGSVVILESTTYPGTTEELVAPI